MIKRFCDRCGNSMGVISENEDEALLPSHININALAKAEGWDVCVHCVESFIKWMNNEKI